MNALVQAAKNLAHRAHAGQVDKAGRPYIEHVARVAAACSDDPEAEAVAWLHDVMEDTDCGGEILMSFPWRIYINVRRLTRMPWESDVDTYYANVLAGDLSTRVKLADIADNADESRLALLDDKTAARLRRKYAKARAALGADDEPIPYRLTPKGRAMLEGK